MYYYGGGSCGCGGSMPYYPTYGYGYYGQSNSNYAIILVLFILLVIVIGARYTRQKGLSFLFL